MNKKLMLNKETVAALNSSQMQNVKGGEMLDFNGVRYDFTDEEMTIISQFGIDEYMNGFEFGGGDTRIDMLKPKSHVLLGCTLRTCNPHNDACTCSPF